MFEIRPQVYTKPEHPNADVMAQRLRRLQSKLRRIELARLLARQEEAAPSRSKRPPLTTIWIAFKRWAISFCKDLDRYVNYCLARWLVWRAMRPDKKRRQEIMITQEKTKC
jgi:hypothetical protein